MARQERHGKTPGLIHGDDGGVGELVAHMRRYRAHGYAGGADEHNGLSPRPDAGCPPGEAVEALGMGRGGQALRRAELRAQGARYLPAQGGPARCEGRDEHAQLFLPSRYSWVKSG